jgi:hypothetical protein
MWKEAIINQYKALYQNLPVDTEDNKRETSVKIMVAPVEARTGNLRTETRCGNASISLAELIYQ